MRTRLVLALLGLAACSEDETVVLDSGPVGPPVLRIASPVVGVDPNCAEVGAEPDERFTVVADVDELLLRPPGACGIAAQCGHLALFVDDVLNNESAVPAIDLLFRKLADRYHDGQPNAAGEPDVLHLSVEVVDELGETLLDHAGAPLAASFELFTLPYSCHASPPSRGQQVHSPVNFVSPQSLGQQQHYSPEPEP